MSVTQIMILRDYLITQLDACKIQAFAVCEEQALALPAAKYTVNLRGTSSEHAKQPGRAKKLQLSSPIPDTTENKPSHQVPDRGDFQNGRTRRN